VNPYNATLTSGGSSGGEGALIGLKGSPLGIGTDIGGSIRSPASNNGVYGFKPTSFRLPTGGWAATMDGAEQIIPCIGPLSTSLEGIKVFLQTLIAAKPWLREPSLLPFEWKDLSGLWKQGGQKLKIGVIWDDGVVKVHPPIARGLRELVEKLKASDRIEVSEWTPYKQDEAWSIIVSC
jgi:amidase